jgi:hypothetical protein
MQKLVFWGIFFVSLSIKAAAPVVHIYCADLYFQHCKPTYTQEQRDSFMRGNLFPDIRYVAHIPRTETHVKDVTLTQINNTKDPFVAGKLFHSYVDEQREKVAQRAKIYDHLITIPQKHKSRFLKGVEDELCYNKITPRQVISALRKYDSAEKNSGISFLILSTWHRILQEYVKTSFLTLMKKKARTKSGYFKMTPEMVKQTTSEMEKYMKDTEVTNYFKAFIGDFERKLRQQ